MKNIGKDMNIAMGIVLSYCLTLTGMLTSGQHFEGVEFVISFAVSTVVSILIGIFVPMRPLTEKVCGGMQPGTLKRRCIEALIADLIYSPIMTLLMISLAYWNNHRMGGQMPFLPPFIKGLIISLIVGFILSFIFMPLFLRQLLRERGITPPQGGPPPQSNQEPKE